MTLYNLAI